MFSKCDNGAAARALRRRKIAHATLTHTPRASICGARAVFAFGIHTRAQCRNARLALPLYTDVQNATQ
eukprot:1251560-Lingulodinium_polyedra.AAC.1